MKESFNNWLTETMKISGVLACGVRSPDRRTFTRSGSPQFTPVALEQACRCLADTFQIINANRFPSGLVRWVYKIPLFMVPCAMTACASPCSRAATHPKYSPLTWNASSPNSTTSPPNPKHVNPARS